MKRVIIVLLIIGLNFISATVLADVSIGIKNFTVVYINDSRVDLSWEFEADGANIMIRSDYNDYPDDIPDEFTAPSDGNLVYYGNALNFSDTSMNFDDNLGTIYYKAWGQRVDGTWFVDTLTGLKESNVVTLILLFGFGLTVSAFAILKKNTVIGIISSAIWLACIAYTRANPIGDMTTGDNADTAILLALIGLMVLVPVISWRIDRSEREKELKEENYKLSLLPRSRASLQEASSTRTNSRSADEYYGALYDLTHRRKR